MRDIEQLIHDWEVAAESDGAPPEISDEERQALAVAFLKAQTERGKIHGWPILGMSFEQARRVDQLGEKMRSIYGFVRESLPVISPRMIATDEEAQAYIRTVGTQRWGVNLRGVLGKLTERS